MAADEDRTLMRHPLPRYWIMRRLLRSGLLTPHVFGALMLAIIRSGINLVALVRVGAAIGRPDAVLADDHQRIGYGELARQAERVAEALHGDHGVRRGQAIGIAGGNDIGFVRALLAASRLATRTILLNPHLPAGQFGQLVERHRISIVLAPGRVGSVPECAGLRVLDPCELLRERSAKGKALARFASGQIVVLTGGTTGLPKPASRAVAPGSVLRLFLHLITALRLDRRRSVYVAVPLFHGFGLSALLVALVLGRTIHLARRFEAEQAGEMIKREQIDTLVVVPTMLQRFLQTVGGAASLRCIVCGGGPLPDPAVNATRERFGDILFNLYGTSEAGLSVLATPEDLATMPSTIGRPVWGVEIDVRDDQGQEVGPSAEGQMWVRNAASIRPSDWIATGDIASRDDAGRLYLHGRVDDMIVSGGENAHPWTVESVLLTHPEIDNAAAVAVADLEFGKRFVAVVSARAGSCIEAETLATWLRSRLARHEMPRRIEIRPALPLTPIGKIDRRKLTKEVALVEANA
jgi:acyl-CoA synthetase (AMP-forming)/AMP-acid ligase II